MSKSHVSAVVTSPFRQDLLQPSGLPGGNFVHVFNSQTPLSSSSWTVIHRTALVPHVSLLLPAPPFRPSSFSHCPRNVPWRQHPFCVLLSTPTLYPQAVLVTTEQSFLCFWLTLRALDSLHVSSAPGSVVGPGSVSPLLPGGSPMLPTLPSPLWPPTRLPPSPASCLPFPEGLSSVSPLATS